MHMQSVMDTVTIHRNYPYSCNESLYRYPPRLYQAFSVISTLPYYKCTLTGKLSVTQSQLQASAMACQSAWAAQCSRKISRMTVLAIYPQ